MIYTCLSLFILLSHSLISGDIGGFMGLLLGGSVITLVEVLDLFIYNFIIKFARRRTNNLKLNGK